jgi:hypothetical protein
LFAKPRIRSAKSKAVKISMSRSCADIQITPGNHKPACGVIRSEIARHVPLSYSAHDMQFFVSGEPNALPDGRFAGIRHSWAKRKSDFNVKCIRFGWS